MFKNLFLIALLCFSPLGFSNAMDDSTGKNSSFKGNQASFDSEVIADYVRLCYAAHEGDIATVNSLLAKNRALVSLDLEGHTPLHYAAWNGHGEVCEVLLKAGADPFKSLNLFKVENALEGESSLHLPGVSSMLFIMNANPILTPAFFALFRMKFNVIGVFIIESPYALVSPFIGIGAGIAVAGGLLWKVRAVDRRLNVNGRR